MPSYAWKTIAAVVLVLLTVLSGCAQRVEHGGPVPAPSTGSGETIPRLAAPKDGRARPLVVVVAENAGTETTDFVIPYGVLKESGVADVVTVSTAPGAVTLIPALRIRADMTLAQFDATTPRGADMVIVPAIKRNDTPVLLAWLRAQADQGATVVSICEGAWVTANAGLLEGKSATTHWLALKSIARKFPGTTWVRDSRWVVDGKIMSTTGVSASMPASLALIEAIAGRPVAETTARRLGVDISGREHDTMAFAFTARHFAVMATNWLGAWRHESLTVPVEAGFDEIATALAADAWSRTFRSAAIATSAEAVVRSRRGLLIETEAASKPGDFVLDHSPGEAMTGLDATLDGIAARYGESTADFVAVGLEHRRRGPGH